MATLVLTQKNFDEMTTKHNIVVIDFWAKWCNPCMQFKPIFEKVSEQFPDVAFTTVDTEQESTLAQAFNIRSIPTLIILRSHVAVFAQAGTQTEQGLHDLVQQAIDLEQSKIDDILAAQDPQ